MAAPKARVFFPAGICSALHHGHEQSDQSGFLPNLSLISCLLIYGRQERANHATAILWRREKYGSDDPAMPFSGNKRFLCLMKDAGTGL
jgi:hypothetical protein